MPYCYECPGIKAKDTDVEPEVEDESVEEGVFNFSVRLVNNCEDGHELEETRFEFEDTFDTHLCGTDVDLDEEDDKNYSLHIEVERTDRSETTKTRTLKSGEVKVTPVPWRYQRRFYGVEATVIVTCDSCDTEVYNDTLREEVQASGMESLQ